MRRPILSLVVLLFVAAGAYGGACPNSGFYDPFGAICGSIYKVTAAYPYGYGTKPTRPYNVKLCRIDDGFCASGFTEYAADGYGSYGWDMFKIIPQIDYRSGHYYDLYAWSDIDNWGSSTVPVRRIWAEPAGAYGAGSNLPPAPLPSSAVNPSNGNLYVPSNGITVRWTKSVDAARDWQGWPVTYEIWFKHWDFGGTEPAYFSYSATLSCNADYTGNCSTWVPSLTPGHWRWFIKTNMDVSASVMTTAVFNTTGPVASFDVP